MGNSVNVETTTGFPITLMASRVYFGKISGFKIGNRRTSSLRTRQSTPTKPHLGGVAREYATKRSDHEQAYSRNASATNPPESILACLRRMVAATLSPPTSTVSREAGWKEGHRCRARSCEGAPLAGCRQDIGSRAQPKKGAHICAAAPTENTHYHASAWLHFLIKI